MYVDLQVTEMGDGRKGRKKRKKKAVNHQRGTDEEPTQPVKI
jgi:hypothetical protein